MKFLGILAAVIIVLAGAFYFFPGLGGDGNMTATSTPKTGGKTYANSSLAISFTYPDSYSLREDDASKDGQEIFIITLADTAAIASAPQGGEGPPSIAVGIFSTSATSADAWIRSDPMSNFQLALATLTPTTVDGNPAVEYDSDGLYATRNVVALKGGRIYMFSVGWISPADAIVSDFEQLLSDADLR